MHVTLPCIKTEPNDLFKYSRLLGIFLTKFAAEVESNITSATFNGIPTGFRGLSRTSCFGNTCMCTSVFLSPELVKTSTRMKSASIDVLPLKRPKDGRKNKRKMANGMNDSHQCDNSHQELKDFICASSLDTYHSIILCLLNNHLTNLAVPRSLGLSISFSKETPGEEGVDWTCLSFDVISCKHSNRSLTHIIDNIMYQKACKKFKRASQKVALWQEIAFDPKRNRLMNSYLNIFVLVFNCIFSHKVQKIEAQNSITKTATHAIFFQKHLAITPPPGGVLLVILGRGVPPGSPNPDSISDQKCYFSHLFSNMAFKQLCHHYLD